jgi:hypothetical protein
MKRGPTRSNDRWRAASIYCTPPEFAICGYPGPQLQGSGGSKIIFRGIGLPTLKQVCRRKMNFEPPHLNRSPYNSAATSPQMHLGSYPSIHLY